jgi:pSer/pThr/pTyr-binding forkhead associated (FHA) protein
VSEEPTIISPMPDAGVAERTQIALAPGAEATQAAISIECPVCHTANPPGDQWCQDCGFLLSAAPPETLELSGASGPRLLLDGREFELHPGANSIGRVGADVLLVDSTVSRQHATLTVAEDGAWIEDQGSTNGTFLNSTPVPQGSRSRVQDGDTLKFGSVSLKLAWAEMPAAAAAPSEAAEDGLLAPLPVVALLVAVDGTEIALQAGVTTVGRRSDNTLPISGDPYVSGRHGEIRCDGGGCVLVDVGSTNGTFFRSGPDAEWERLRPHDPRPLSPGDEVRFGQVAFTFQAAPESAEAASLDEGTSPEASEAAAALFVDAAASDVPEPASE